AAGRLKADKAAGEFRIDLEELDTLAGHDAAVAAAPGREPDTAAASDTGDSRLGATGAAALSELVAMIERQQAQLLERTEAAAVWQARAEVLAERLALAESRLLALQAPQNAQDATPDAPTATQG